MNTVVSLGLTKKVTLVRFERAEISNIDVKEKKLQTDLTVQRF